MAIASISGSSSSAPIRTSMEPIKGVKDVKVAEPKSAEKTIVAQENEDKTDAKTGLDPKRWEEFKGVKEVDTKG